LDTKEEKIIIIKKKFRQVRDFFLLIHNIFPWSSELEKSNGNVPAD